MEYIAEMSVFGKIKGIVGQPAVKEIETTQDQYNIVTDVLGKRSKCQVFVTCDVGKQIRTALVNAMVNAKINFVTTTGNALSSRQKLEGLNKDSGMKELSGVGKLVKDHVDLVQKAYKTYEKEMETTVKLDLECIVALQNSVDASGADERQHVGKIVGINPAKEKIFVTVIAHKKGKPGAVPVTISNEPISLSKLCVGGDKATENAISCDLVHKGGYHSSTSDCE